MLTRKQQELLLLIHRRLQADGVPPSFDEMKDALDLKSKSGIHRLITALEERGFIRRLPNRARALEVIKLPEAMMRAELPEAANAAGPTESNVITADFERAARGPRMAPVAPAADDSSLSVPLMGRIAAGVPISAIQDHSQDLSIPADMLGPGTHYALTVSGDSMIEAGIHDGDTVVIRESQSADVGDIVVALVDEEEATLKRFRRKEGAIALEAANPAYETRILPPNRVRVQGRLVGLLRRY